MLIQSGAIQADQSAPLVAAEVRAAEARHGTGLPQFDGKVVVVADASGGNAPLAPSPNPAAENPATLAPAGTPKPAAAAPGAAKTEAAKTEAAKINDTQDARVVAMIHRINQGEIKAGKLAGKNGWSRGVKDFGAMLVKDHEAADKKFLTYAASRGMDLKKIPPVLPEEAARQRDDMARLNMLSGQAFDHGFATNMQDVHTRGIDIVQKSRVSVNDPKLRELLANLQPLLQKHEHTAQQLAAGEQPTASTGMTKTPATHGRRPTPSR
jgi:putative membrane protein